MDIPQLFIHSPTDGYLSCFQCLVTKNDAAMNIHIHIFVWNMLSFLSNKYLGVELQGHMVSLCLINKRSPYYFPFIIPTRILLLFEYISFYFFFLSNCAAKDIQNNVK